MAPPRNTSDDFAKALRDFAPYLGLGTTLAVTVGLACALGYWLDGILGTKPILALFFGVLGVAAALSQFVRLAGQVKPQPPADPDPSNP